MISIHLGRTEEGMDYAEFLGDDGYEEHIVGPFDDFLHKSYSTFKYHKHPG